MYFPPTRPRRFILKLLLGWGQVGFSQKDAAEKAKRAEKQKAAGLKLANKTTTKLLGIKAKLETCETVIGMVQTEGKFLPEYVTQGVRTCTAQVAALMGEAIRHTTNESNATLSFDAEKVNRVFQSSFDVTKLFDKCAAAVGHGPKT